MLICIKSYVYTMKFFFILAILIITVPNIVKSFPFGKNVMHNPVIPTSGQLRFMQRFGYLDGGEPGFEAQYTDKSISEAILNIQKFGAIELTGKLDAKTIELMKKRRCGVKDVYKNRQKRYSILHGWKKREITYYISNWNPSLGEKAVAREIHRALNTWAVYGNLTFVRTNNPSSDIIVAFEVEEHGDPFPFDGPGNILAHAFFPYVLSGGDIHFDNDETWTTSIQDDEDTTTDFFSVAVHELGHSLGLGHSDVPTSIMFPYYRGHDNTLQLDHDDILAMYELYFRTPMEGDSRFSKPIESPPSNGRENTPETTTQTYTEENTEATPSVHHTTKHDSAVTYSEDYEAVDDKNKHDTKHYSPKASQEPPTICDGKYDAVAVLRQELFVFKENNVWRFKTRGKIEDGYPTRINDIFPHLPLYINKIDAAYEKPDGTIAFFSGSNYWIYADSEIVGPYSFHTYGLSQEVEAIDAVFVWKQNEMTYLFKDHQFWRFNESTRTLDEGYPKNMTRWRGISNRIDAAITWNDGSTYFFKGSLYWRFDNTLIKADKHYPLPAPQYWFGCPENDETFMQLPLEILSRGYMQH